MPNRIFVGIMSILLILSRFNPARHLSRVTGHLLSTHGENAQSHVLLRSSGDRASRRTFGDGLLPLRSLPELFRRAGQRIHVVEDRQCESHQRRRVPGKIQTKRNERSPLLHKVRRPHHGRSSNSQFDRRPPRSAKKFSVQTNRPLQLRRDGSSNEGRLTEAQRLSSRRRRLGPGVTGVARSPRNLSTTAKRSLQVISQILNVLDTTPLTPPRLTLLRPFHATRSWRAN